MRKIMIKKTLLLAAAILIFMISSGCYTVLRPTDEMQSSEGEYSEGTSYNEDYGYTHYYYPGYWSLYPRWGHYYATPWWWEYEYYDDDYYDDDGSPRSPHGERATRVNTGWQPQTGMGPLNINRGSASPSSSGSASGTSTGSSKEKTTKGDNTDTETKTKQEKDDAKKPSRGTGGWRQK